MRSSTARALRARIDGKIIPAVPVPFDNRESIDATGQARYIEWMSRQAIGGVAIWAHTGRGLWLNETERAAVLHAWRAALPDRPVICGAGVPHHVELPNDSSACTAAVIRESVAMAQQAKAGNADGLLAYPPRALGGIPDAEKRIVEYHEALADVGLPVIAFFLYEEAGGVSYSPEVIDTILSVPGVVGMKVATLDSVMTFQDIAAQLTTRDALLITGEDRFLGYSFTLGARSALVGIASAVTDRCVSLIDAWNNGDLSRFQNESRAMDVFAMTTFRTPMEGYVQRMLWAAEADGVLPPPAHDRHAPQLSATERQDVRAALRRLRG